MTTTAHEDQFTAAPEPVRQPYDTSAILRRNIADMEVALRTQTERAEAAEAELARLREQKPFCFATPVAIMGHDWTRAVFFSEHNEAWKATTPLYAAPVPAPHKGATHCDDCGLTWLDDGLNPLGCPYCKDAVTAPAVPAEWREVMAELAADVQAACDAEHPHRDQYPSVMRKYNNDMEIVEKSRALLQSSPQAPAVPAGWTEWNGGSIRPVLKDDQCNYEFLRRDGQLAAFVTSWKHGLEGSGARDIVAYRRKTHPLQSAEVKS